MQYAIVSLRELRKRRNLTQVQLAKLARLSQPEISQLENGNQNLGPKRAKRLARALGVSVESLLS